MDIFGADLFYFLIPFSISFFLYNQKINTFFLIEEEIIIIGFFISFLIVFKRMIGIRNYLLFVNNTNLEKNKQSLKKNFFNKIFLNIYEHPIIRGNFFEQDLY